MNKRVGFNSWINTDECMTCTLEHKGVSCSIALKSKLKLLNDDLVEAKEEKLVVAQKQVEEDIKQCEQLIMNLAA